jgi:hypothetical protein
MSWLLHKISRIPGHASTTTISSFNKLFLNSSRRFSENSSKKHFPALTKASYKKRFLGKSTPK